MLQDNFDNITVTNPFVQSLACTAIHPGLRSILVFDAPYAALMSIAALLSQMLECSLGQPVKQVQLGVSDQDDDLWGSLTLHIEKDQESMTFQMHGLLAEEGSSIYLVVIPDLTQISLAAARACVVLMGADVAQVERYGQKKRWKPNICWLANCSRSEIGSISPHLLDRFALRLNWISPPLLKNATHLLKQIRQDALQDDSATILLSEDVKVRIQNGASFRAALSEDALEQVLFHSSKLQMFTQRRELALARQAVALAQFEGSRQVTVQHVDMAAYLIGLISSPPEEQIEYPLLPQMEEEPERNTHDSTQPITGADGADGRDIQEHSASFETAANRTDAIEHDEPVYAPDEPIVIESMSLPIEPYPEDKAPITREAASLRLPLYQTTHVRAGHGTAIGVERTNTLQDLAITSTLIAAIPFQPIRRKHMPYNSKRLLLSGSDLRCYRREPSAELMLLLLIDYTSLRGSAWQGALFPYLRKAYIERASVGIIQVGATNASHELRAELVSARSILVPRIETALNSTAGRTTPLAHGLDIALNTLRLALQHGRSTIDHALFLALSDGRGNIPLDMSRRGIITAPVNREGVDDALRVAHLIGKLKDVQIIYLNPQPSQYRHLPLAFADALGANLRLIPQLDAKEV